MKQIKKTKKVAKKHESGRSMIHSCPQKNYINMLCLSPSDSTANTNKYSVFRPASGSTYIP